MNNTLNTTNFGAANTSVGQTLVKCPMQIPMLVRDTSFVDQATKVSIILAITFNALTMPLILFLNGLIIFVVWKSPCLHVERVIVLAYLALSDFLVGLVCQSLVIPREVLYLNNLSSDANLRCQLDIAAFFSFLIIKGASFGQLIIITYERYVAVIHPMQYSTRITVKRLTYATLGLWTLATAMGFLAYIFVTLQKYSLADVLNIFYRVPMIACMMYWNIRIFAAIRKQKRQIAQQQQNVNLSATHNQQENHKGAVTAVLLLCSFIFSFILPFFVFLLKKTFGIWFPETIIQPWLINFLSFTSLFNPLIYFLGISELREKCFQILRLKSNRIEPPQNGSLPSI